MDKKDLVPGDLIVTKVAFSDRDNYYHDSPYMLDAKSLGLQSYYWDETNRLPMIARAQDWCFRVHENFPSHSIVQVSFFDRELKHVPRARYGWAEATFNTFTEFFLYYDDISLVVDPVCADCYNYCKQLCFKNLVIWR